MTSVGEMLRTEREVQGREVAEIVQELCISQSYLLAIEQDDLERLPGIFFYKSFAKQYAALLGVEIKEIQPGLDALTATAQPLPLPGADPRYPKKTPEISNDDRLLNLVADGPALRPLDPLVEDGNRRDFPDRRLGLSLVALLAMLLGCSGFYAWWNARTQSPSHTNFAQAAPQVEPKRAAPGETAPGEPTLSGVAAPSEVVPSPAALGPAALGQDLPSPTLPSQDLPSQVVPSQVLPSNAAPVLFEGIQAGQPTAPPAPIVDVTTTTGNDGLKHVVLSLSATEETWLSVTSAGKQIFSGILQPSQTKTLTGLEVAKMRVGNAGGLEVRWNGKAIGPIGPRGQVRIVLFTPENVQILGPAGDSSQGPSQTL